jgi:hypothetical protein
MSKWIEEELEPGLRVSYGLKELLHSGRSKFQTVDVADLEPFGRCLLIDGLIQSCQVDEFVYHESLVHPALLSHPCPKSVYIGVSRPHTEAPTAVRPPPRHLPSPPETPPPTRTPSRCHVAIAHMLAARPAAAPRTPRERALRRAPRSRARRAAARAALRARCCATRPSSGA